MSFNWKFWAVRQHRPTGVTKAVTEAELAGRFASAPDNPLFEAVLTLLSEKINSKATEAANEQRTDREILWRVAGTDALMEFLEDLKDRETAARQNRDEQQSNEGTK